MALEEAAISDDVDRMYTVFFDGFFNWLTEQKLSKDNIRDVTSAVRDLMMGHGVSSKWRPGPPFLAGFRFDPTVHCARELRELGKSWMPPRRPGRLGELLLPQVYDSSNGWTVDHPAGYIDKYLVAIGAPPRRRGLLPPPPPPPTAAELASVSDRPFTAGGVRTTPKRARGATKKRPREEEQTATPVAAPVATPVAAPTPAVSKRPAVPDLDVQEARILFRNSALVKHLRAHPLGDWIQTPHLKRAGKHAQERTKDKAGDAIKGVIREWLLTTPAGRRALAAADVGEGELSIDRVVARHEKHGMTGLNCIYNLYLMPTRHNACFGAELTPEKRVYIGERAFRLAKAAHDAFVRDTEAEYDWDVGFSRRAEFILNS